MLIVSVQNAAVRLLVISLAHYGHLASVFLKHILSNLSPYSLSQSLLRFQANLRIISGGASALGIDSNTS